MENNRYKNIIFQVLSQCVAALISLYVTSYVVEHMGETVYGFVGLANNFVNYASIITVALNSMASRFIANEIFKNNVNSAQKYYSTTFFSNIVIAIIFSIIGLIIIINLNFLLDVPKEHLIDIQLLWFTIFLSFAFELMSTAFKVTSFVTNKIYLSSVATILGVILRAIIIGLLFGLGTDKIWFVGFGTLVSTTVQVIFHFVITKKLMPNMYIKVSFFKLKYFFIIIKSGIWNTISQLGKLLTEGLDLLLTNAMIGAQPMGILSISKVLSTYVQLFNGTIANTLIPQLMYYYSRGDKDNYFKQIYEDMDFLSYVSCTMLIILNSLCSCFYKLWVPSQNTNQLTILTILGSFWMIVSGVLGSIFNAFTVENKLRFNSITMIGSGIVSTVILIIFLKYTNLGIYAVAAISSVIYIIKNIFLVIPYADKHLGIKKIIVYKKIIKCITVTIMLSTILKLLLNKFLIDTWLFFFVVATLISIVVFFFLSFVFLSKEKRRSLFTKTRNKI